MIHMIHCIMVEFAFWLIERCIEVKFVGFLFNQLTNQYLLVNNADPYSGFPIVKLDP